MEPDLKLLTLYSNIRSEPVQWIWYPYIASGKITLLQGDPGDGKSSMMLNIIAELTKGGVTPDGKKIENKYRVIYQCSEDGAADTIKPRLEGFGADCERVAFLNEEVHTGLTLDDERIRSAIIEYKPKLVVIDPVQAYLGNDSDLMLASRARRLSHRIGLWAAMFDCAIVLIGHLNKHEGGKNLYRGLGSIDIVAAARSVLQVERKQGIPEVRVVHQIKNSLAPIGADMYFEITPQNGFRWLEDWGRLDGMTDSLIDEKPMSKQEKAATIIKRMLTTNDMKTRDILSVLNGFGIGERTAQATKAILGIVSYRKMGQWYWSINRENGSENTR